MQIEWFLHAMILLNKMGNNLNGANFSFYPFYFQEKIFKSIMNPLWAAQKKTRVNILCPVKRNWG
jgi:Fe-S cluster biosynthesis and repair protein YggX